MTNYHLAILKKQYLDKILDGTKTVESRIAKNNCPPFGRVSVGDIIFFKQSSGPVCATAEVSAFRQFDNLTPEKIIFIKNKYNDRILGEEDYWQMKADCRFATLIRLKNVKKISPIRINKKDFRAWIVLKKPNDFGLLDLFATSNTIK